MENSDKLEDKQSVYVCSDKNSITAAQCANTTQTIVNGTIDMIGIDYLSTINYTCYEGHYFDDNETMHMSVCQADETWSIAGVQDQICSRKFILMIVSTIMISTTDWLCTVVLPAFISYFGRKPLGSIDTITDRARNELLFSENHISVLFCHLLQIFRDFEESRN